MKDQNEKGVILCFDLSEGKSEEITQPDEFECNESCYLGIIMHMLFGRSHMGNEKLQCNTILDIVVISARGRQ